MGQAALLPCHLPRFDHWVDTGSLRAWSCTVLPCLRSRSREESKDGKEESEKRKADDGWATNLAEYVHFHLFGARSQVQQNVQAAFSSFTKDLCRVKAEELSSTTNYLRRISLTTLKHIKAIKTEPVNLVRKRGHGEYSLDAWRVSKIVLGAKAAIYAQAIDHRGRK